MSIWKIRNLKWITISTLIVVSIIGIGCGAEAQGLGSAAVYNVYVLGNDTASYVDSQGAVAVGGTATFTDYTVGDALKSGSSPNLVVGGTLNASGGGTITGSVYGTNINYSDPSISGNVVGNAVVMNSGGNVYGNVTYGSSLTNSGVGVSGSTTKAIYTSPINFNSENQSLLNESTACAALTANGTTTDYYNGITCTGSSSTRNVFNITGTQLANCNGLTITAPSGSTVIINVSGTSDTMENFATSVNNDNNAHIIYNFYQAQSLALSGISIDGSVLAAGASVTFSGGNINGELIAGSLVDTGGGEAHNGNDPGNSDLFAGILPNGAQISVVPEPPTGATLALGLIALIGLATGRRKKTLVSTSL